MTHAKKVGQPQLNPSGRGFAGRELLVSALREAHVEGFQIRKTLGKGGMGTVYLARDAQGKDVALKLFRRMEEANEKYYLTNWFLRECTGLMIVSHPNVVSAYGTGATEKYFYLSMEKAEGRQLKSAIDRFGAFDWESSASIMSGIFGALEEIHRTGIVHRDVKPENIIVKSTKSGPRSPKLVDFGLCYIDGFSDFWPRISPHPVPERYTPHGADFSTPEFRAPEFNIEGASHSPPFDIYAAGLTFYNLAAGRLPFDTPPLEGGAARSLYYAGIHKFSEFERPRAVSAMVELPAKAETALMACLDRNPDMRPTAREMKSIIESC